MQIKRFAGRDEGFSLAEVVVAAAILFFVLTAVVGLIGASQTMSVMAKHKTTLTNATAEYIDRIRALAFTAIATPPSGEVPPSETISYHGHEIEFTNQVVMSDSEGGKYLRTVYVRARATIQGRTYRTSAVVHIKNPNNDTTAASVIDEAAPVVWFTDDSAPENAVVYGDLLWTGPSTPAKSLELEASAQSADDTIVNMVFGGSGTLTPDAFTAGPAVTLSSTWDTSGIPDGLHKVVVQATDTQERNAVAERQFIVDNIAPGPPGTPVITTQTSTETHLSFAGAPDPVAASGTDPVTFASSYRYSVRKSPLTGGSDPYAWDWLYWTTDPAGSSLIDSIFTAGPIKRTIPTDPYSRYYVRLRALSPRGLVSTVVPFYFVSAPETYSDTTKLPTCTTEYVSKVGTTYDVTVYLTQPTFPVSSVSYTFYAKPSGGSWAAFAPTGTPSVTADGTLTKIRFTYKTTTTSQNLWFKIGANVTPSDGLGAATVTSNAFGLTPLDPDKKTGTAVTATMTEASWSE